MQKISRRSLLTGSSAAGLALTLGVSGCGGEDSPDSTKNKLTWWDGGAPQIALNRKYLAAHASELGNAQVEITRQENSKFGQALQLARQSNQMPDLTVNSGLGLPLPSLIANGWFQPLDLPADANERLKSMGLVEGIHIFDGKPYAFPVRGPGYNTITWFHTDPLAKADLDPNQPPATYDEFREACRKIRKSGGQGLLHPLAVASRNALQADFLAQAAGFAGSKGQLFGTGEYAYHSDAYLAAIEFLYSLHRDGLMVPGGLSMNIQNGEARWAAGASAFFFDGPWIPGVVALDYPKLKGKVGAGPMLVPDRSRQPAVYWEPMEGTYHIPKGAKNPDLANRALGLLTTMEYQVKYAEAMGHAPREIDAVKTAKVDPVWRKVAEDLDKTIFTAPTPVVRNIDTAKVEVELKPVQPGVGNIIQGYFSGDITNLKGALTKLSDASAKELDRAVGAAKGKGAKVSLDDYAFANWKPFADFTNDMYG